MRNLLLLGVFVVSIFAACKKDKNAEPELPPYTQEGKNVIAWRMDGKVYVSERTILLHGPRSYYVVDAYGGVTIAGQTDSPRFELHMRCPFKIEQASTMAGTYPYRGQIFDYSSGTTIPSGSSMYQTDSTHTGTVTVTYYDSSIIAGYFQMDVVNEAGEVKHITDGRFDIGPD